jgi:hypothetical protein
MFEEKIIVHVSGASGSGKTTLGTKLKKEFGSKIVVKDLDNLRDEFIDEFYKGKKWGPFIAEEEYQKYIDRYIAKQTRPIIFVGLNDNTRYGKNKKLYYDLHSQYNYYIDIDIKEILKQRCLRLLTDEIPNDQQVMIDLVNNNKQFIKGMKFALSTECSLKNIIKMNKKWDKDYKKQEYKFMSREDIYKSIIKILKRN